MSSWLIEKEKYVKAAGLMHGIEQSKRHPHKYFVDNVKQMLERCYNLNRKSWNKQYERNCKGDKKSYDDVFEEYTKKALAIMQGKDKKAKEKLKTALMYFFSCADYQIEDAECEKDARAVFYDCIQHMTELDTKKLGLVWGEIEVD